MRLELEQYTGLDAHEVRSAIDTLSRDGKVRIRASGKKGVPSTYELGRNPNWQPRRRSRAQAAKEEANAAKPAPPPFKTIIHKREEKVWVVDQLITRLSASLTEREKDILHAVCNDYRREARY